MKKRSKLVWSYFVFGVLTTIMGLVLALGDTINVLAIGGGIIQTNSNFPTGIGLVVIGIFALAVMPKLDKKKKRDY